MLTLGVENWTDCSSSKVVLVQTLRRSVLLKSTVAPYSLQTLTERESECHVRWIQWRVFLPSELASGGQLGRRYPAVHAHINILRLSSISHDFLLPWLHCCCLRMHCSPGCWKLQWLQLCLPWVSNDRVGLLLVLTRSRLHIPSLGSIL